MPSINGGSQFDDDYAPQEREASVVPEAKVVKRDFHNLDVRLYLALREIMSTYVGLCEDAGADDVENSQHYKNNMSLLRDFEDSFGSIPEWATARNFGLELVVGAQLFTKNGRLHGNGWIVKSEELSNQAYAKRDNPYGMWTAYSVLTDAGSIINNMSASELEEGFEVGDWICSLERISRDFDRHNHLQSEPGGN